MYIVPINNANNTRVKVGIENLYPMELFEDKCFSKKETIKDDGTEVTTKTLVKNDFLDAIKNDNNHEHFENFQRLINKIRSIL
jgi:hypothetical protein